MTTIDPGHRVRIRIYDLLQLPASPQRDQLIRRVTERAKHHQARADATKQWVNEALAEAEQHRKEAAAGHQALPRPTLTAAELAWHEAQRKTA